MFQMETHTHTHTCPMCCTGLRAFVHMYVRTAICLHIDRLHKRTLYQANDNEKN